VDLINKKFFSIFFILVLLTGCAAKSVYIEPRGAIDNSIYYYEIDRFGEKHPISSNDIKNEKPEHVPYGALADLDSIIYIKIVNGNLYTKKEDKLSDFEKKKNDIKQALGLINGIIESRSEAVRSYIENSSDFKDKRDALEKKERNLLNSLKSIWNESSKEYIELDDSYDPPKYEKLIKFLQKQIDKLDENLKVFITIKAFLEKPTKEKIPIHLDYYDSADEEGWREYDRWAYKLSPEERKEIEKKYKEINEFINGTNASIDRLNNDISECINNDVCKNSIGGKFTPIEPTKINLQEIKDTFIDLKHLPRSTGDIIRIKAALYEGEKERDTSVAKFRLEKFGWYSEISPAVVLAKPDQLKSENNGFRFIPVISWMHYWVPRPEDNEWINKYFLSPLQPSLGIHTAMVNFKSDTPIQIGIGVTLAFWQQRLQFGAGYNFMAKSSDEGRYYYFIGTDLIQLLGIKNK